MFNWFFQSNSVDDIISGFQTMITRLEQAMEYHGNQAQLHYDESERHVSLGDAASNEQVRALQIRDKLKAFVA